MEQSTLHIHLKDDGAILVKGKPGTIRSIAEAKLREELAQVKSMNGAVVYSRDHPQSEASPVIEPIFKLILSYDIPIVFAPSNPDVDGGNITEYIPPLLVVAYHDQEDWLDELLHRGVNPEIADEYGQTALMMAANAGHLHVVEKLIAYGADVNAKDLEGTTPIMFAAQHGYIEIVKALISAGADIKAKGNHGFDAQRVAEQNGHKDVVELLTNRNVLRRERKWWRW